MKNNKALYGIIAVLILIIAGLVINSWYAKQAAEKQEEQLGIFQQGAQYGYEQAVIQVAQQAATCQQVPLTIENQTINLIAVECLQAAQTTINASE